MHIARVEVRQYRGLQGLELDLAPGGRPGLVVVEGPNEAGKSTLLAFMRALLFPEPRSASDAAELVSGSLTLQDGDKRYRVERDGPRATSRLTDLTTGELLDLPRLAALLGNLDATVYRNVFAFGLSELQAFDALGNEAVKERLYSAAVAGAGRSASEAAGKLEAMAGEILKPRAQSRLGDIAKELAAARKAITDARSLARGYAAKSDELGRVTREAAERVAEQRGAAAEAAWLERLLQLWPDWQARASAQEELARLAAEELSLAEPDQGGVAPETWLRNAAAVHALSAELADHRKGKEEAAALEAEQKGLVESCLNGFRVLGPAWGPQRLAEFSDHAAWRKRAEDARAARAAAAAASNQAKGALETAKRELAEAEREVGEADRLFEEQLVRLGKPQGSTVDPRRALETLRSRAAERRSALDLLLDRLDELTAARAAHADLLSKLQAARQRGGGSRLARWLTWAAVVGGAAGVAYLEWAERRTVAYAALALGGVVGFLLWPSRGGAGGEPLAELRASAEEASVRVGSAVAAIGEARSRLGLGPEAAGPEARAAMREVEERLAAIDAASAAAAACGHALAEAERRRRSVAEREEAAQAAAAELVRLEADWSGWCREAGAPASATPDSMPDVVGRLERLQDGVAALKAATRKLKQLRPAVKAYEARVAAVAAALGRPVDAVMPVVVVGEWAKAVADAEALEAGLRERRERLEADVATAQQKLETLFGARAAEAAAVLDERDPQALERSLAESRARAEALERAAEELTRKTGALKQTLDDLASSADLAGHAVTASRLETEGRVEARRWLRARLAKELLAATRAAYEREKVPTVLRRAGEHLAAITGGRYVRTHLGDDGGLRVFTPTDDPWEASRLSRGTQEQLYLAVRLGLVESFSEGSVALPIVLDDVLVNADPDRGQRLAGALALVAMRQQLLYLTCHPHTARLLLGLAQGGVHVRLQATAWEHARTTPA